MRSAGIGDLLCKVVLETPVSLTDKQKALLKEFKESLEGNPKHSPKEKTWIDGVKDFFETLKG